MKNGHPTNLDLLKAINDFRKEIREMYVTQTEFFPVKAIVFGLVAIGLGTLFTALVASIVRAVI